LPTAVYIEYPRITAIEMTGSARKPRIQRVLVGALPEGRNEDGTPVADKQGHLNTAVETFLKENKLGGGKLYLLVGPDGMRYRDIHLAFSDRRQIDRVLQFQVEGVIPNVPIEEMTLGYNILRADPDGAHLLVHAADKEYVRSRIIALEEAGLVVEGGDSHLSGTLNLGMLHPEFAPDTPPTLWLDFAGTIATVAEVHEGKVASARVFVSPYLAGASGGTVAADGVKDAARAAQEEAEVRAREFLGAEEGATLPASDSVNIGEEEVADRIRHMSREQLDKFLNRVAVEAKRTLLMSNLEQEPQRLVVSGLGGAGDGIAAQLGDQLELQDARAIELLESVNPVGKDGERQHKLPDLGEMSYLAGVALKGVGRDYTQINFRYGDLAAGTLFDYAKTPLAFTATLTLLFAGILFLMSFTHARNYEKHIADLRDGDNGRGGPQYYYDSAFKVAEELKKNNEVYKDLKIPTYPASPDDPAQEIHSAHAALRKHIEYLKGETDDNYEWPHEADQIMAEVLRTIQRAVPSYDFALVKFQLTGSILRLEYYVSLSETPEEKQKIGVPAAYRDSTEDERLFAELRLMADANKKWFKDRPRSDNVGNPMDNPAGKKVQLVRQSFELADTKKAKKSGAKK
jgi:hypothetical protein